MGEGYPVLLGDKARPAMGRLFPSERESMIRSWLEGIMGKAFGNRSVPDCGQICLGDFSFFAGDVQAPGARELARHPAPDCRGGYLAIGLSTEWNCLLEQEWGQRAQPLTRYAMAPPQAFDRSRLAALASAVPQGMELRQIDRELYYRLLEEEWSRDFCANFAGADEFLQKGLGVVLLRDNLPVAGASSYAVCRSGLEIEIDVREEFRRQGLGTICCAALVLLCLDRGWTPFWDAANLPSVALAQKLGYRFFNEYRAYWIQKE